MLTTFPVACPREGCGWGGNLLPSVVQGGAGSEVSHMQRAWFRCPRCGGDWEVRIADDKVTVVPGWEHGG
jgi:hypothetical protein